MVNKIIILLNKRRRRTCQKVMERDRKARARDQEKAREDAKPEKAAVRDKVKAGAADRVWAEAVDRVQAEAVDRAVKAEDKYIF